MTKKIKRLWVADLRNPDLKQCQVRFSTDGGYCPLGRLCVVLGVPLSIEGADNYCELDRHLTYEQATSIIRMNDVSGMTFFQIADWIEENV